MTSAPRSAPHLLAPLALFAGLVLVSCRGPTVEGSVVDPWGHALEDVTVIVEGVTEEQLTNEAGRFEIETERGAVLNMLAGREGYIKGTTSVRVPRGEDAPVPEPVIVLYPDPEEPGFYVVGESGYVRLDEEAVRTVGTELTSFTGVADAEGGGVPAQGQLRVVFATNLRRADISRLDLRLSRLEFVERQPIKDVYGETEVTVNLWVARESVPFELTGLASATDYLLTSREPLPTGAYAFHIQGVLTDPDVHHLERLPKEMRVAYPFEVR